MMDGVTFSDVVLVVLMGMMGWAFPTLLEMKRNVRDLHKWHSPDDKGRQTWKDMGPLLDRMDRVVDLFEESLKAK